MDGFAPVLPFLPYTYKCFKKIAGKIKNYCLKCA